MPITLKQLEAFHAVMELGSVTRASQKLGVSQPAISRIIADLEANAGFALFTRAARSLVPTAQGRALHAEVERTYRGLEHIEASLQSLRDGGEGQLRIGVVPSLLSHVSLQLIAPFMTLHPQATVSVEVVATLNALDWSSFRQTDLGITFEAISGPGIEVRVIGRTEAACVVSSSHRLATRGTCVDAADLAGEQFISYMPESSFRAEIDRLFAGQAIDRRLRLEARTTAAVCELAIASNGAAIVPSPSAQLAADHRLTVLRFTPTLGSDIVIVRPADVVLSPLARTFAEFAAARRIDAFGELQAAGYQAQP